MGTLETERQVEIYSRPWPGFWHYYRADFAPGYLANWATNRGYAVPGIFFAKFSATATGICFLWWPAVRPVYVALLPVALRAQIALCQSKICTLPQVLSEALLVAVIELKVFRLS